MDFNTKTNRDILIKEFPKLKNDSHFVVNSPITAVYNCIAFAMGLQDRWVDNNILCPGHWWPPISDCSMKKEALIKAFEYLKFQLCEDASIEEGYDKVVLFCDNADNWTHAARIIGDGIEHSKFGQGWDAFYSGNGIFAGSCYGQEYAYMKRAVSDRVVSERLRTNIGSVLIVA